MAFYHSKNSNIKLNNAEIFANSVELSTSANVTPIYTYDKRHAFDYNSTNNIQGNLRLNYYLTGNDILQDYFTKETSLSGFFGGIYFTGGYLSDYSLDCTPNTPVVVNANIVFFDQLNGTFSPVSVKQENYNILNYSNATIYAYPGYSEETLGNVSSINYSYNAEITPTYYFQSGTGYSNLAPDRVSFGQKKISTSIICDDLTSTLPMQGKKMGVKITLGHPALNISPQYICSGILTAKNINSTAGDYITNSLTILQNSTDVTPLISSFDPFSGTSNDLITIYGSGFTNATDVYFNQDPDNNFSIVSDSKITAHVPYNAFSGNIKIYTYGGNTYSSSGFNIVPETVLVKNVTLITGNIGDTVQLSGSGFYRIDSVFFTGSQTGRFRRINANIIETTVPSGVQYGKIGVGSSLRRITGYSLFEFVPIPQLTGFIPLTGVSGDLITGLGNNLFGLTYGSINSIQFSNFAVTNNNKITFNLPGGNTKGYMWVSGLTGVNSYSPTQFSPQIYITGIAPSSGRIGDPVRISGYYFNTGLMYITDTVDGYNSFRVGFEGYTTGFITGNLQQTLLTGRVPTGTAPGQNYNVYIYQPDGASVYPSTTSFRVRWDNPRILDCNSNNIWNSQILSGSTGGFMLIGKNLADINSITFTGIVPENAGYGISFTNTPQRYITGSKDGTVCLVTGYPFTGYNLMTGRYQISMTTNEGSCFETGYLIGFNAKGVPFRKPSGILIVKNYYISAY